MPERPRDLSWRGAQFPGPASAACCVWTHAPSYRNPKVDEPLNAAGSSLDPTRRKACYATFQKIVIDELPLSIVNRVPYSTATARNVGNVPNSIRRPLSPMDEVSLK